MTEVHEALRRWAKGLNPLEVGIGLQLADREVEESLACGVMSPMNHARGGKWRKTAESASSIPSCSQMRTTVQPVCSSRSVVSRSRSRFACSFDAHHAAFLAGDVPCWGHPCQKQPSTNTATLRPTNKMSALRRGIPGSGASTRYRYPRRCRARLSEISGAVSRVRCRDILRDVAGSGETGARLTRVVGLSDGTRLIMLRVGAQRACDRAYNSADTVSPCRREPRQ